MSFGKGESIWCDPASCKIILIIFYKMNEFITWMCYLPFSYPEPILRAVNGARQGALAKSISNWHLIGHNEGCCSNTGYILLPCFYGIRLWIWPEPLVAPRVRRALGTRMVTFLNLTDFFIIKRSSYNTKI
jgi:hypothetical protein